MANQPASRMPEVWSVGQLSGPASDNVRKLGQALFTDYLFAFEITSVLLVIAVVAAVVLARRAATTPSATDEPAEVAS